MSKSEKLLKLLSDMLENGILSTQDVKKEVLTNLKFQKDNLVSKLDLVSREEFEILKKIVVKQNKEIKLLKKKKLKR
ncbi:MAG: accessory factor UbiK family protein [Pelagibacteraceae bacterium]